MSNSLKLHPYISIVIPVYNEADNLKSLFKLIRISAKKLGVYELIFVDDGSSDKSLEILQKIKISNKEVKVISFIKNYGQTAALSAGIDASNGKIIVTMDADLQNDPNDISKLVAQINKGYDVASGWRKNRHFEAFIFRRIPSIVANKLITKIVGLELHDYGCTFKAYRSGVIKNVKLYGEMHRFIPAYAFWRGAKIAEVPISYRPRKHGKSKYNLTRTYKVILDLMTIKFLESFITKPIYLFGTMGLLSLTGGLFSVLFMLWNKMYRGVSMIQSPLLLLSALFVILGVLFIVIGLLAEIIVRTYYESQGKKTYLLREEN